MIKILIVDDEPLVQIGLRSMIDWSSLGAKVCGTASNGDAAWDIINEQHPDIVITDIQMPCSSGLELGKRCMDELGRLPVFIILTNYEDFQYAREALGFHAVDYLVKIDLTPESLSASVKKAIEQVNLIKYQNPESSDDSHNLNMFRERFYIRLLNNLFESCKQFQFQKKNLKISLDAYGFAAATIQLFSDASSLAVYNQTLQMLQTLLSKYISCHTVALDTHFLAVIFMIGEKDVKEWKGSVRSALESTFQMLHDYYNVSFLTSIGRLVINPLSLSSSYSDSRQILSYLSEKQPLIFYDDLSDTHALRNVFSMSLFRDDLSRAFQELDEEALRSSIDTILSILGEEEEHAHFTQALDAAGSILHLSITLLPGGSDVVSEIFKNEPDNYLSLYHLKSVPSIISWLSQLEEGLCLAFAGKKKGQQNTFTKLCCQYINEHVHEKIFLQDIADTLGISPNYLSQLFKKSMNVGVSEYINMQKIEESKKLLRETTLKIYEISERLGYESSFYFSKVFKKITGISPKEYRSRLY